MNVMLEKLYRIIAEDEKKRNPFDTPETTHLYEELCDAVNTELSNMLTDLLIEQQRVAFEVGFKTATTLLTECRS